MISIWVSVCDENKPSNVAESAQCLQKTVERQR